jgi:hypothetical protein
LRQKKVYFEDRIKFISLIEDYEQFIFELNLDPKLIMSEGSTEFIDGMSDKLKELKELPVEETGVPSDSSKKEE